MHQISAQLRSVVPDVFRMMISTEMVCDEQLDEQADTPLPAVGVIGAVSFTGKMSGVLYLIFSEPFALHATESILGKGEYKEADINDVVGELTNIVTGNLKSKMCDLGYNCRLSIPTVIRGKELSLDTTPGNLSLLNCFHAHEKKETISALIFATLED